MELVQAISEPGSWLDDDLRQFVLQTFPVSAVYAIVIDVIKGAVTAIPVQPRQATGPLLCAYWRALVLHPQLPECDYSLVIKTDFSDDRAWERICHFLQQPQSENSFFASVECISDPSCSDLTPQSIASILPDTSRRSFVFLVDARTVADPEHAVLVVDLLDEPGRSFRVVPSEAWGVENNLRLANMEFAEFVASADEDTVFRNFPQY